MWSSLAMTSYKDRTRQVLSGCRSVTLTERKNGFGMDESGTHLQVHAKRKYIVHGLKLCPNIAIASDVED